LPGAAAASEWNLLSHATAKARGEMPGNLNAAVLPGDTHSLEQVELGEQRFEFLKFPIVSNKYLKR
jgi:hypothetical protein